MGNRNGFCTNTFTGANKMRRNKKKIPKDREKSMAFLWTMKRQREREKHT